MSAPSMERRLNREQRRLQRKAETAVAEAPSRQLPSLVAAAVNARITESWRNVRWGASEWQTEGWLHYDTVPEFKAAVSYGASSISRARLIGVEVDPITGEPATQPTDDPTVADIMGQLFGGPAGQGQALAALKRHLDVPGEGWVHATDSPELDGSAWTILGCTEVLSNGAGKITVEQLDGTQREVDTERELLIRIWRPSPRRRWEADSPTKALLPVLREINALTAMVSATVKSRLASAGILWLPDEITLPKQNPAVATNSAAQVQAPAGAAEAWLDLLTEAMTTPIKDPDSAGAVVPMVAMVKGEYIDKISHMEFGRDLDATVQPLREANLRRLAVGTNAPPEILLGLGDVNHWTGWLITEDYARAYLAPDLELICDALTRYYLHPALRSRGIDPHRYAVYFDLDALVPKQVSTENATAAYAAGLLAEDEYMAALGFSIMQKAGPKERMMRLIIGLAEQGLVDAVAALAPTVAALIGAPVPASLPEIEAVPTGGAAGGAVPAGQVAALPGGDAAEPATLAPPAQRPAPAPSVGEVPGV